MIMQKIKTTNPYFALSKIFNLDYGDVIRWAWTKRTTGDFPEDCPVFFRLFIHQVESDHRSLQQGDVNKWFDGYTLWV